MCLNVFKGIFKHVYRYLDVFKGFHRCLKVFDYIEYFSACLNERDQICYVVSCLVQVTYSERGDEGSGSVRNVLRDDRMNVRTAGQSSHAEV